MSEMVERVARAIYEKANEQSPVVGTGHAEADDGKTILDGAYDLLAIARAAIEAMRVPTEKMIAAGMTCESGTYEEDVPRIFTAMIDAALEEAQ